MRTVTRVPGSAVPETVGIALADAPWAGVTITGASGDIESTKNALTFPTAVDPSCVALA
jgi:hypothetical protein